MNCLIREVLREVSSCFSSRNRIESGVREEDEEPRQIRFLEGTDFLGAMMRRLNERERDKRETKSQHKTRREKEKKRNVQCMKMHEHVKCKNKLHHGQKPYKVEFIQSFC